MTCSRWMSVAVVAFCAAAAVAGSGAGVIDDADSASAGLFEEVAMDGVAVRRFAGESGGRAELRVGGVPGVYRDEWVEDESGRFGTCLRVEVLRETDRAWNVVVHGPTNVAEIPSGDWVMAVFYTRTAPGAAERSGVFRAFIERSEPTWLSVAETSGTAPSRWNRYVAVGQVQEAVPAGALKLSIHLGFGPQAIDIAGLTMLHLSGDVDPRKLPYTRIDYEGIEPDAPWRARAEAMIHEHRMGELVVRVVGADGTPVEGASVEVEQLAHAYEFGTFFSDLAVRDTPEAERYRGWILENFNYATTPVYWADWGWANPERRRDYLAMAEWLQSVGRPARGHVLVYPGWRFAPAALKSLVGDPVAFQARILAHLEEIVPLMKARGIREYDVTNELRELSDFTDIVGMEGVVEWFRKVHELDPDAALYINENSILTEGGRNRAAQDHYFNLIQTLLEKGAPLHGIGMQGHASEAVTSPEVIWRILDRFAVFGLPIRITEYDFATRDEAGQAAYDRDFTTAIFAHPATVGMTGWGFYEPVMWRPLGAMIRADGVYKPNGLAHRKLLFETWHTHETGTTDAQGNFTCRAFFGTYRARIGHGSTTLERTIELTKPGRGSGKSRFTLFRIEE